MTKQHVSITVIIPTLARSKSLRRLLDSVAKQTRLPEQIIIVDASEDHDTEAVVSLADAVLQDRLEYYRAERGLTRQRNFGLQKARGEIIGFFDDDVVLDENYLEEIAKPFASDPHQRIGGATGYIYSPKVKKNIYRHFLSKIPDLVFNFRRMAKYYHIRLLPEEPFEAIISIRYLQGCNMFLRKQVFQEYQFDSWFEGYGLGEDLEFGLRVSQTWRIVGIGAARLYHLHDPSGRPNYRKLGKMWLENRARILVLSRTDLPWPETIAFLFRYWLGIHIVFVKLCLGRSWKNAYDISRGGWQGLSAAIRLITISQKRKKRNA